MSYNDRTSRVPGAMVNPDYGLFLKFMLNPEEITITKDNNYSSRDVPGWHTPQEWWTGGGFKSISFSLFYDKSDAVGSGGVNLHSTQTPLGLRDVESVLQEFQYPKNPARLSSLSDIPEAAKEIMSDPEEFLPPPDVFLVYGLRVWRCHLVDAPIREVRHDERLNPTQIEVDISLRAVEEGSLYDIQSRVRRGLALTASGQSAATAIPDLFSDLL